MNTVEIKSLEVASTAPSELNGGGAPIVIFDLAVAFRGSEWSGSAAILYDTEKRGYVMSDDVDDLEKWVDSITDDQEAIDEFWRHIESAMTEVAHRDIFIHDEAELAEAASGEYIDPALGKRLWDETAGVMLEQVRSISVGLADRSIRFARFEVNDADGNPTEVYVWRDSDGSSVEYRVGDEEEWSDLDAALEGVRDDAPRAQIAQAHYDRLSGRVRD